MGYTVVTLKPRQVGAGTEGEDDIGRGNWVLIGHEQAIRGAGVGDIREEALLWGLGQLWAGPSALMTHLSEGRVF